MKMARPTTEDSHFPSAMNIQDLMDMSNSVPEDCATTLPKSNALRTLATGVRPPPPTPKVGTGAVATINYKDPLLTKMASLLKTNALSDVTLIVGDEKTMLHAHKLILALASPVFNAMFYGELANNQHKPPTTDNTAAPLQSAVPTTRQKLHHNIQPEPSPAEETTSLPPLPPPSWQASLIIEIPDCSPQAMKAFLQYIYSNGTTDDHSSSISVDDALSLLYTARKYSVSGLEDKCVVTLSSSITAENVFDILYAATFYNLPSLDYLCWEFMEDNPVEVLNTHLEYLTHDTLQSILKNDKLNCGEVELFQVLMKWVEQECSKMNLEASPENVRRLCATELKMIRFPVMTGPEFAEIVVPTGVLTVEQVAKIFTAINTSEERKREQQDSEFPSRSSVFLNGMEFSSKRRTPNRKPKTPAQTHGGANPGEDESINRPPVFTFIAEQQIRNREQQQQNHIQSHQQPVNGGSTNVFGAAHSSHGGGNPVQMLAVPSAVPSLAPNNVTATTNNSAVGVVDYGLPAIVGIVPLNDASSVTQAGERGRNRQRHSRRSRRRSGSNSSEGQPPSQPPH